MLYCAGLCLVMGAPANDSLAMGLAGLYLIIAAFG